MDEELIQQARHGDQQALGRLLTARGDKLYKVAYLYLHNRADALDAVQETALQAMLGIHRLQHLEYFDTWLMRIAMNCAFKMLRQQARKAPLEPTPEAAIDPDLGPDLRADLLALPKRYQEVLLMYYYQDLPMTQIAAVLHVPVGTVKSRLSRALAQLRQNGTVYDAY